MLSNNPYIKSFEISIIDPNEREGIVSFMTKVFYQLTIILMSYNCIAYKVAMVGDSGVGKTSIVSSFIRGTTSSSHEPTLGAAFDTKFVNIGCEKKIKLQIWDTAGQERFKSLIPMYYRNAQACICVFDVTNYNSIKNLASWVNAYRSNSNTGTDDCVVIMVANKIDMPKHMWYISLANIEDMAKELKCEYVLSSVNDLESIDNIFTKCATIIHNNSIKSSNARSTEPNITVQLTDSWKESISSYAPSCSCK